MPHSGCHGNSVIIAARYVAYAYRPKEPPYLNMNSIRLEIKEFDSLTMTDWLMNHLLTS